MLPISGDDTLEDVCVDISIFVCDETLWIYCLLLYYIYLLDIGVVWLMPYIILCYVGIVSIVYLCLCMCMSFHLLVVIFIPSSLVYDETLWIYCVLLYYIYLIDIGVVLPMPYIMLCYGVVISIVYLCSCMCILFHSLVVILVL